MKPALPESLTAQPEGSKKGELVTGGGKQTEVALRHQLSTSLPKRSAAPGEAGPTHLGVFLIQAEAQLP